MDEFWAKFDFVGIEPAVDEYVLFSEWKIWLKESGRNFTTTSEWNWGEISGQKDIVQDFWRYYRSMIFVNKQLLLAAGHQNKYV